MGTRSVNVLVVPGMGVPYSLQFGPRPRKDLKRIALSDQFVASVKKVYGRFMPDLPLEHLATVIAMSLIGDGVCDQKHMPGLLRAIDTAIYHLEAEGEIKLPSLV